MQVKQESPTSAEPMIQIGSSILLDDQATVIPAEPPNVRHQPRALHVGCMALLSPLSFNKIACYIFVNNTGHECLVRNPLLSRNHLHLIEVL